MKAKLRRKNKVPSSNAHKNLIVELTAFWVFALIAALSFLIPPEPAADSSPSTLPVRGNERAGQYVTAESKPGYPIENSSCEESTNEIITGLDKNGNPVSSKAGKFLHHKYKIGGDTGAMLKQIRYKNSNSYRSKPGFEESIPHLQFKLTSPDGSLNIDSTQLTNKHQAGIGGNNIFVWGDKGDIEVDSVWDDLTITFPETLTIPPNSTFELIVTEWNFPPPRGYKCPKAGEGITIPDTPENRPLLTQPAQGEACSVLTVYNGAGGNSTPTMLKEQRIGSTPFVDIGANGWKYNAMAYSDVDYNIYAISQHLDDQHPGGHVLAVNPSTGQVTDMGDTYGMLGPENCADNSPGDNDKCLISTGFFTPLTDNDPRGEYWVANASNSGSGKMYSIDLKTGEAKPAQLKRGPHYYNGFPTIEARSHSNDYAVLPDNPNYAWGIVNQQRSYNVTEPYMERITLSGAKKGEVNHYPLKDLKTPADETMVLSGGLVIYGAAWAYGNGTLGFDHNGGEGAFQIRVDNPDADIPTFTLEGRADAASGSNNDGTSCLGPTKPDLEIVKKRITEADAPEELAGKDIYWSVVVTNNGVGTSGGYHLDDILNVDNYTGVELDYPSASMSCTISKESAPPAVQCYGDRLAEDASRTIYIAANYKPNMGCVENTVTNDGFDGEEPGNEKNNSSTAPCRLNTLKIEKNPATDQDASVEGDQPNFPLTISTVASSGSTPEYKKAEGIAKYDITITNTGSEATTLLADSITDTLTFPGWVDVDTSQLNVEVKEGDGFTGGEPVTWRPEPDTATYQQGQPYSFVVTAMNNKALDSISVPSKGKIVLSVEIPVSAPLADFVDPAHSSDVTCTAANPPNADNPQGFFNEAALEEEADTVTDDNYACLAPEVARSEVQIEKGPRPGATIETTSDGKATLTYTIQVTNPSDTARSRVDDMVDSFELPTGVSFDTGDVTFEAEAPQATTVITGLVNTVSTDDFAAAQNTGGYKFVDAIELNPGVSQTITVNIPVIVAWGNGADATALKTCDSQSGSFSGGVQNSVSAAEWVVDKDGDVNNTGCIPLSERPSLMISLEKYAYSENGTFGTKIAGAEFSIMTFDGTTYHDVTDFELDPNDGNLKAELIEDGHYLLVETKAPDGGYQLLPRPVPFEIVRENGQYSFVLTDPEGDSVLIDGQIDSASGANLVMKVADIKTGDLPATGPGDQRPWIFITFVIVIAMFGLNYRRRPNI